MTTVTESLAAYLGPFGQAATLDGRAVRVIFDNAYAETLGMATRMPQAQLPTADVAASGQGSTLVLASTTYRVRSHEPDGTGWSTLSLELAA
jgi:hypothetical protein